MQNSTSLKTERAYINTNTTIDEFYDSYRELLPTSTFDMPKLVGWNTWDYYTSNVILGCSLPLECGADIAPAMRASLDIHNHFSHVRAIARSAAWANLVAITGGNIFLSDRMSVLNERGINIINNAFTLAGDDVRAVYLHDDRREPSLWKGDNGIVIVNWEEYPRTVTVGGINKTLTSAKVFTQDGDTVTVTLLPHESFAGLYRN